MSETKFTKDLREFLEENNGGSIKLGASMFLAKGTPDMICFYKKCMFMVEDKVYPNTLSPIQRATIIKIRKEGGHVWCATLMPNGKISVDGKEFDGPRPFFDFCVQQVWLDRTAD
jgi:Neuraminidase (sialidase)